MICVEVCTMGGDTRSLQLPPEGLLEDLKAEIDNEMRIPSRCQKLIQGSVVMNQPDNLRLCDVITGECLTLLVCLEPVLADLNACLTKKKAALRDLICLGHRAAAAVDLVCGMLAVMGPSWHLHTSDVMQEGLDALGRIAHKGDDLAIETAKQYLKNPEESVKQSAIRALARISEPGRQDVITAIYDCYNLIPLDSTGRIQLLEEIVSALGDVSLRGDHTAVAMVKAHVATNSWRLKREALTTLGKVAMRGDQEAISAASSHLADGDMRVRQAAFAALGVLAQGDKRIMDEVQSYLSHPLRAIRQSAVLALTGLVQQGDRNILDAVLLLVKDSGWDVRQAALLAIGRLAEHGNQDALVAVRESLDDEDNRVRLTAVTTICGLALLGDQLTVNALVARLDDGDSRVEDDCHVQSAAVLAIGRLVASKEQFPIVELSVCLWSKSKAIRQAAITVFSDHVESIDRRIIGDALFHLEQGELDRKLSALAVLGLVAGKAESGVIDSIIMYLESPDVEVREASLEALGKLLQKGDPHVMAIGACVQDDDWRVRLASLRLLGKLGKNSDAGFMLLVQDSLQDSFGCVRQAAIRTFINWMDYTPNSEVLSLVGACLEDEDEQVRAVAAEAMQRWQQKH